VSVSTATSASGKTGTTTTSATSKGTTTTSTAVTTYNSTTGTYTTTTTTTKTATVYFVPDDRGVNCSYFNPQEVVSGSEDDISVSGSAGISVAALDLAYPLSSATTAYGAYYDTRSQNSSIVHGKLGELALSTQFGHNNNWFFKVDGAKTNGPSDGNRLLIAGLTYNRSNPDIKGSWDFTYEWGYLGYASYIKTTPDINDKYNGRQGYDIVWKFVPVKNVVWYTRWLEARDINGSDAHPRTTERWIRSQIDFLF
jgi:hypothetical protein